MNDNISIALHDPLKTTKQRITLLIVAFVFLLFWHAGIGNFIEYINPKSNDLEIDLSEIFTLHEPSLVYVILMDCVVSPIWEEIYYRYTPITIAKYFSKSLILPVLLASSMIFGFSHHGQESVLFQGVTGLVLSYLYIKTGYKIQYNIILHSIWNLFCTFV